MMMANLKPYPVTKDSGVPWLGHVPEHWTVWRLKQICRLAYGEALATDVRVTGTVPVYGSNGRVGFHSSANTKSPCIIVGRKGSFGKVNYSPEPVFAIDTTFFIDDRFSSAYLRWVYYLLGWLRLDEVSKDSAVPGLQREDAYQRLAVLPPLPEQAAIVRFLDHVDRRIRRYIRAKQKLIKLLEEQKQAIIHRAVTRGLDSNVRLKPSGVEWLGDVPEHWEVRRLKYLSDSIQMGPFGASLTELQSHDTGYKLFGQENTISGDFTKGQRWVTTAQYEALRRYELLPGDLVLTRKGSIGKCKMVPSDAAKGIADSDTIRVRLDHSQVLDRFVVVLLQDAAYIKRQIESVQRGAILAGLNTATIGNLCVAVPPLGEQTFLLSKIDAGTSVVSSATVDALREIGLLREHRTRLIADVVTGKLDVREAAARLPDGVDASEPLDEVEVDADVELDAADEVIAVPEEADA
jgi:type I restriction enzyme, S subunit